MESVVKKPFFIGIKLSFPCPRYNSFPIDSFSAPFFQYTCFNKCKRSSISVSSTLSSNPHNPNAKSDNHSKPSNRFPNCSPILKKIKSLASAKRWASIMRASNDSGEGYLQNGGLAMALLSATTMARVRISPLVAALAVNPTFVSWILAWFMAQSMKVLLNFFVERKWDLRILFASGGMPSSHSALCTALTASVAICHGVADSLFPVCLGFSVIVMYDAIGVRRHAGMQAQVLNVIVEDLFQGHPISKRKLKELLGHTPSQVVGGALLGIVVACVCCQGCSVAI